ncbi:SDR family oxidoreductase [Antarcticibacterium sp. 1MA-6-2]|uniref:SDR family oxidoreductase n=1 Tax=Antarcticibacterium sp. 1MA-6-2 TaxID=2908210 RepID=UPI001F35E02D|nr:SDR family oxidoreductase [Antarcticibacterium sp. 1MA-6-2]UJH90527.1 SDR family oxidoreductase [Antarcticibacterium sp. 1MA-6-2]
MILVTGGTGLVGSHILLEILKTEETVKAIYRESSNVDHVKKVFSYYMPEEDAQKYFSRIDWLIADLNDIPSLEKAFVGVKKVYHCAALVSFDSSLASKLRKVNIEGTANIANLCIAHNIEKLCYISSIATMDANVGDDFISENFTWHPEKDHTEYAISKHGAEIEVWRAAQEGVPVIILNPGIIIGPGFWNKGSGEIFNRVHKGLKYHFPKITGFVGVRDVSRAAIQLMLSPVKNEQYILVAENLGFKEILDKVAIELGKPKPASELKPWMITTGWLYQSFLSIFGGKKLLNKSDSRSLFENAFYKNDKIVRELDFHFTPIKEVIEETANFYKRNNSG